MKTLNAKPALTVARVSLSSSWRAVCRGACRYSGKRWLCATSALAHESGISRESIGRIKGGFICRTLGGPQAMWPSLR